MSSMVLQAEKDPMGKAILDYYTRKKAHHLWVYSDIAECDEIKVKYLFRSFHKMPKIEQLALQICHGQVLDVGAASGSHSLWLAENRINVISIDISAYAVETMKNRGVPDAVCQDFFEFTPNIKFDSLLFLMNGAGIAGTKGRLGLFFDQCRKLLKPGGNILLDSSDISYMFDNENQKPLRKYYGEVTYIMRYDQITSDSFNWLFIDFETLKTEAQKYGFACQKMLNGSHYDYLAELHVK